MEEKCFNERYDKCVVCESYDNCVHRYYVEEGRHYYIIPAIVFLVLFSIYFILV